jgi:DNA-binding response OmpR family regulator
MENHILIIEDNQDILDLVREVLTSEGYQVTALNYCDDIIKTVARYQPDLLC